MIRIVSIQAHPERGGSDHALLRMMRALDGAEFEKHVVVPAEPKLRRELEDAGATVHLVGMMRISGSHRPLDWLLYALRWPLSVARLARLLRRLRADVVHTNTLHSWYGCFAARIARRPHVWHAREIVVPSSRSRRAIVRLERWLLRHFATRVISMSHAIAQNLWPGNVVVIHETVDPGEFTARRAGRFRLAAGIADDAPLVGWAGRVDAWKGLDLLLDAFSRARDRASAVELAIVGTPVVGRERLYADLEARARRMAGVRWQGEWTQMPEFFADLDLFVLSSTDPEPYGLVLVEALACGVPTIAPDEGGPPEIAAAARSGGVRLVPSRDARALADAIVAAVGTSPPSSAAARSERDPLIDRRPEPFADVFRAVVGSR